MAKQLKQDFYFIYSEVECGNFKGYRLIGETLREARKFLGYVKKNKKIEDSPVHSIIMTRPVTDWESIKYSKIIDT